MTDRPAVVALPIRSATRSPRRRASSSAEPSWCHVAPTTPPPPSCAARCCCRTARACGATARSYNRETRLAHCLPDCPRRCLEVERSCVSPGGHTIAPPVFLPQVDVQPTLEIDTDDVVCTHGATVSDLDDEMVFYLQVFSSEVPYHLLPHHFLLS